ncbi:MAG: mechanosensitive ion channel family protein [Acidimicrobiia bacterium]
MTVAQSVGVDTVTQAFDTNAVTPWDPVWALLAIVVGVIVGRFARSMVRRYGAKADVPPNIIDLIGTIALWTIVSFSVVVSLTFVGFNAAPLILFILIVAIVLVIGGRSLIENFGAGVMLQARAPFEPGDEVMTDEFTGEVLEVNSRVVVILTLDNRRVYVPNTVVLQNAIVNLTHDVFRMGEVEVDVAYGSDLDRALNAILEAANAAPEILDDPPSVTEIRGFAASGVTIRLRYAHKPDVLSEWAATNAAAKAAYLGLRDAGITIPFPQRTLWWGDGPHGRTDPDEAP